MHIAQPSLCKIMIIVVRRSYRSGCSRWARLAEYCFLRWWQTVLQYMEINYIVVDK